MKVLVTGANGYIGSRVVKYLCEMDVCVVATDIFDNNVDKRANFIKANLFETNKNWYTFFGKPDVCLHLAWRDGFIHNSYMHLEDLPKHFNFIKNLIDNGLKQVACMGTMHEVGYYVGKINEQTPCNPMSLYGISKNTLRQCLSWYCNEKHCVFQWLRAFYIYGSDDYGNSIFCKIRQSDKEGKKSFPFTSGKNEYDFINVDLLAEYISRSIVQSEINGIINVCSGKPVPLGTMVENYIKANNLQIKLDYDAYPDRPYDSPCIYGDNTKIKNIIKGVD